MFDFANEKKWPCSAAAWKRAISEISFSSPLWEKQCNTRLKYEDFVRYCMAGRAVKQFCTVDVGSSAERTDRAKFARRCLIDCLRSRQNNIWSQSAVADAVSYTSCANDAIRVHGDLRLFQSQVVDIISVIRVFVFCHC